VRGDGAVEKNVADVINRDRAIGALIASVPGKPNRVSFGQKALDGFVRLNRTQLLGLFHGICSVLRPA
jgi:hypothetical protein